MSSFGGLAANAPTATQEELMLKQSSGQVAAMQDAMARFVRENIDAMDWLLWYHPTAQYKTRYVNRVDDSFQKVRTLHPWNAGPETDAFGRQRMPPLRRGTQEGGPYQRPRVKIDAYTMRQQTPDQVCDAILQIVTQVYIPMAQIAMQQGDTLDTSELFKMVGELKNIPRLAKVIRTMEVMQDQMQQNADSGASGAAGPKPAQTERTYTYQRADTGRDTQQNANAQQETAMEAMASQQQGQQR